MTTDTIAVIVGEMRHPAAMRFGEHATECIQNWASRLDALGDVADEYRRWLDFYHSGEGDFDDFMRKEFPDD